MSMKTEFRIGIPDAMRATAAALYDQAFGLKFAVAVRDPAQRRLMIARALNLQYAVAAIQAGRLVGLAGFHTSAGSLTDGIGYNVLTQPERLRQTGTRTSGLPAA